MTNEIETKSTASSYLMDTRIVLLALIPLATVLMATMNGIGVSPDSTNYLASGQNLSKGLGLVTFNGSVLTIFPPGLPMIIACGRYLGIDGNLTMRLVNAVAFFSIVLLTSNLLWRNVSSKSLVYGGTFFVALSPVLLGIATMALTETLFVALSMLFIYSLEQASRDQYRSVWVVMCAFIAWIGFYLRYSGLSMVAIGAISLALGMQQGRWTLLMSRAALFTVLAILGPAVWMIRNIQIDGTLMGKRAPSEDTLAFTLARVSRTIGDWLLPIPGPGPTKALVGSCFLVLLVTSIAWLIKHRTQRDESSRLRSLISLKPTILFGLISTAYVISAQLFTAIDGVNSRLLSASYIPLVITGIVVLDRLREYVPLRVQKICSTVLVSFVIGQAVIFFLSAYQWASGRGFAQTAWKDSELVAAISRAPGGARIYSNIPDGIYAVSGRQSILLSPKRNEYRNSTRLQVPAEFLADVTSGSALLAWFRGKTRDYVRTPEELSEVVQLSAIKEFSDGTLYKLAPIQHTRSSKLAG